MAGHGHLVRQLALGGALACVIGLAPAGTAKAADDDHSDSTFFGNVLTTLGLKKDGPGIDYRERSPLVIPPKRDLPPPERGATESNPAWPVDPEIRQKKESAAFAPEDSSTFDKEARPLRPDQLTPGRKPGKNTRIQGAVNGGPRGTDGNDAARPLRPSELGYTGGFFGMFKGSKDEEVGKFTAEPPRASLTDPPAGYQTPSPNSPYGVGKDRTPTKPTDYQLEHGTQNSN
jgi:hypothetical protein